MSIISKDINKAIELLNRDEIIAIPTETVYGLAGNIYSEKAIRSIFEIKERPFFNPLIVHIPSIDALESLVEEVPDKARLLAEEFWPGPLTLILKKKPHISDLITAGKNTVAVRIPNHPVALELLNKLDFPLAAPSANPFNRISPTTAKHVEAYFGNNISLVLDGGPCEKGIESTIIGFEANKAILYRFGSISREAIEKVIGPVTTHTQSDASPEAPGMLQKHYSPRTKTILTENLTEAIARYSNKRIGVLSFKSVALKSEVILLKTLSNDGSFEEAASHLYSFLHELDHANLDIIIIERLPEEGIGVAINDRLSRAAQP